jgi:hypothetical protein
MQNMFPLHSWSARIGRSEELCAYTHLSSGFSRKMENHVAATALNYFSYNFIKIHRTLRTFPAIAAGVTDRVWIVEALESLRATEGRKSGLNELANKNRHSGLADGGDCLCACGPKFDARSVERLALHIRALSACCFTPLFWLLLFIERGREKIKVAHYRYMPVSSGHQSYALGIHCSSRPRCKISP